LQHGKRADSIVKGMLEHSRVSSGQKSQQILTPLQMNIYDWIENEGTAFIIQLPKA
jgi:hypothetical protein